MTICTETLSPAVVAASVAITTKNSCKAASFNGTSLGCPDDKQAKEAFDKITKGPIDEINKKRWMIQPTVLIGAQ